jgi:uncharacterized protein (UPF0332 family)
LKLSFAFGAKGLKQIDFSQLALVNGRNEQSAASIHFAKTHRGLINAFSEHLVKDGTLSRDLGRSRCHSGTKSIYAVHY